MAHSTFSKALLVGLVLVTSSLAVSAQETFSRGSELNENAWDFNAPGGAPGFGPISSAEARALLPLISK